MFIKQTCSQRQTLKSFGSSSFYISCKNWFSNCVKGHPTRLVFCACCKELGRKSTFIGIYGISEKTTQRTVDASRIKRHVNSIHSKGFAIRYFSNSVSGTRTRYGLCHDCKAKQRSLSFHRRPLFIVLSGDTCSIKKSCLISHLKYHVSDISSKTIMQNRYFLKTFL